MPNGDYEYTDISLADFEAALNIIINQFEAEAKRNTPAWQKMARTIMPSWAGKVGAETIEEQFSRMFDEIMVAVTQYGLSPDVAKSLAPGTAEIFTRTLQNRANYEWQKQYKKDLGTYEEEVAKAYKQYGIDWLDHAKWAAGQDLAERKFQWQQEQAQMGWQQQQGEWQQKRWEKQQDVRQTQWEAQGQRWAKEAGRPREGQEEKSRIWQSAQSEILAGLTGEQDWIKRWQAQQTRNPYAPPESNVEQASEYYDETKAEYQRRKAAANIMRKRMKDPQDPLSQAAPEKEPSPEQWYAQQVLRAERTAEDKFLEAESELEGETYSWGGKLSEGLPTGEGGTAYGFEDRPPGPWHPGTPQWLSKMYPERTEEEMWGTRLGGREPSPLAAPSAQAWGRLSPSQQAGWMGYAEHTGGKPQDLLTQMWKMQPRTPQVAQRWQPARQMA